MEKAIVCLKSPYSFGEVHVSGLSNLSVQEKHVLATVMQPLLPLVALAV